MNLAAYLLSADELTEGRAIGMDVLRALARKDPNGATVISLLEHLALADALEGNYVRAAELLGYTEQVIEGLGFEREYTEIVSHDRLTALLRERLTNDERAARLAAGAALTPPEAIALLLREL